MPIKNSKFRILILTLASLLICHLHAATPLTLSPIEQKMVQFIDAQKEEQISLLEKLVNINSGTENILGVKKLGEILKREFDLLGFKTYWVEKPASMHRAPTLIATYLSQNNSEKPKAKAEAKRLLLIGHLDTVFPANSPFQNFERNGDKARGPGVIDMKGGDLVILYALKALKAADALDNANIRVVLTGDEEDGGRPASIARKPLFQAAKLSDIALDFECSVSLDTATIARRGIGAWTLKTEGMEAHSASIFTAKIGNGAIFELARILNNIQKELSQEENLSINPGLILGGTELHYDKKNSKGVAFGKANVVSKTAIALGDIRFLTETQKNNAIKTMQTIVEKHLPGTKASLALENGIPAMPPTKANLELLEEYSKASEALGYGKIKALPPKLRGAGDISYIAAMVSANLAGLGPFGSHEHSTQENIELPSLALQTKRAAILMYRLMTNSVTMKSSEQFSN